MLGLKGLSLPVAEKTEQTIYCFPTKVLTLNNTFMHCHLMIQGMLQWTALKNCFNVVNIAQCCLKSCSQLTPVIVLALNKNPEQLLHQK